MSNFNTLSWLDYKTSINSKCLTTPGNMLPFGFFPLGTKFCLRQSSFLRLLLDLPLNVDDSSQSPDLVPPAFQLCTLHDRAQMVCGDVSWTWVVSIPPSLLLWYTLANCIQVKDLEILFISEGNYHCQKKPRKSAWCEMVLAAQSWAWCLGSVSLHIRGPVKRHESQTRVFLFNMEHKCYLLPCLHVISGSICYLSSSLIQVYVSHILRKTDLRKTFLISLKYKSLNFSSVWISCFTVIYFFGC